MAMISKRTSIFETNSSSTHSISIVDYKNSQEDKPNLVQNNILYPNLLYNYELHYGETTVLSCINTPMKLSLLIHWLFEYCDNAEISDDIYHEVITKLKEKGNYDDIVFESSDYYYFDDDNRIFDKYNIEELIDFCFNDNIQFIYSINPY